MQIEYRTRRVPKRKLGSPGVAAKAADVMIVSTAEITD